MAKSSNETIFSLTLTEVVIILFFTVILLFALKEIPPEDADCLLDDPTCVVGVGDEDDVDDDNINICEPGDICFGKCLQVSKEENSRGYYYLYTILIDQKDFIVKLGEDNEKVRSEFNNLPSSARTLLDGIHTEVSFRNLSDPILKYELEKNCRYFVKTNYSEPTSAKELNNGLKTIDEYFLSLNPEN